PGVNRRQVSPLPHRSVRINSADDLRLRPHPARTALVTGAPRTPTPCRLGRGVGAQRMCGYCSTALSVVKKISAPAEETARKMDADARAARIRTPAHGGAGRRTHRPDPAHLAAVGRG